MKLADEMRVRTQIAEAQLAHEAEIADQNAKQTETLRAQVTAWFERSIPEVKEVIEKAAAEGRFFAYYTVAHWENDISQHTDECAKRMIEYLVAEGFTATKEIDVDEPCGSDSYFPHTVYSTVIKIGW